MGVSASVISIVGHSGSGKTTLIEKLIYEFRQRGLRVATIKHAHHKVELDSPGKDSWRYTQAGASMSMLVTSDGVQLIASEITQHGLESLVNRFMGEVDLVLAEGFSHESGAKIEVLRRECSSVPRCRIEDGLVAIVTDMDGVYPQIPHFALDDIDSVARFLLDRK